MDKLSLEQALKAVISTNLGLQNSLGNYANQAARAISLLTAQPSSEARLDRIENSLNQIGNILNNLQAHKFVSRRPKRKRRKK